MRQRVLFGTNVPDDTDSSGIVQIGVWRWGGQQKSRSACRAGGSIGRREERRCLRSRRGIGAEANRAGQFILRSCLSLAARFGAPMSDGGEEKPGRGAGGLEGRGARSWRLGAAVDRRRTVEHGAMLNDAERNLPFVMLAFREVGDPCWRSVVNPCRGLISGNAFLRAASRRNSSGL